MNNAPRYLVPSAFNPNEHLVLKDAAPPLEPYDHQRATWDGMTRHYLEAARPAGMVVLPTGGGKTIVAAHWLLRNVVAKGGRVLWLAPRRGLLRQAFATFKRLGNLAHPDKKKLDLIAVSGEGMKWSNVSPDHDVIFASVQSSVLENNRGFVQELLAQRSEPPFVVIDEAHHAVAPQTLSLLAELKRSGARLLGLTATPVRMDAQEERRLGALFDGAIIHQISRNTLSNLGILATPSTETVKTQVDVEKDMDPKELAHLARYGDLATTVLNRLGQHAHRNKLIVEQYVNHRTKYGPTIVFAADTLHAQTLVDEFRRGGVPDADYVDYSRKDAAEIAERYRRGELDVIVNVQMLTEGFDAPRTRTVFIARPTRSESLLGADGRARDARTARRRERDRLPGDLPRHLERVRCAQPRVRARWERSAGGGRVRGQARHAGGHGAARAGARRLSALAEQREGPARRRPRVHPARVVPLGGGVRGRRAVARRDGVRHPARGASHAARRVPDPGVGPAQPRRGVGAGADPQATSPTSPIRCRAGPT
jgi:superfamily II DNA or RNA helicase